MCGLVCTPEDGPFSPLRGGSANNIYVIPAPSRLTFNTATLLAAACCIPAILLLVSMWIKIMQENGRRLRRRARRSGNTLGEEAGGINGATAEEVNKANEAIQGILRRIATVLYGAAILVILIIGEWNLYTTQVRYMTEPMANIGEILSQWAHSMTDFATPAGQWAPIVGTGLALFGSLYLLIATNWRLALQNQEMNEVTTVEETSSQNGHIWAEPVQDNYGRRRTIDFLPGRRKSPEPGYPPQRLNTVTSTRTTATADTLSAFQNPKVQKMIQKASKLWHTPGENHFEEDAEFRRGVFAHYPETPGELLRNPRIAQIRAGHVDEDEEDDARSMRRSRSRTGSFRSSYGADETPPTPTSPIRRDTLEVPTRRDTLPSRRRSGSPPPLRPVFTLPAGQDSPAIVIESDSDSTRDTSPGPSSSKPK